MKKTTLAAILLFLSVQLSFAQLEDRISQLNTENLKKYFQPLATSIGSSLNSGGYYSASTSKIFGFSIGVRAMAIFIPSDQLTFVPKLPDGYSSNKPTATILGDKGGYYAGKNGYATYPPGLNSEMVPLGFPQASISALGTELLLRFVPTIKVGGRDFNFIGFGVKHSLSQYLFISPVDVAVQVLYTKFSVTDLIKATSFAINAQASKSFGLITLYGGVQSESSNFDIDYTIEGDAYNADPELQVDKKNKVSLEGENKFRFTAGAALNMGVIVLNADFSVSKQSVLTAGLSFAF